MPFWIFEGHFPSTASWIGSISLLELQLSVVEAGCGLNDVLHLLPQIKSVQALIHSTYFNLKM